jgi:hypothetical protein
LFEIIILININLNLEKMKLVQLALIGGGAYLAYNYLQKRKANKAKLDAVAASDVTVEAPSASLGKKEEDMVAAEMQEVGEEGMAIATEGQGELTKLAEEDTLGMDGWDSDNLTSGI